MWNRHKNGTRKFRLFASVGQAVLCASLIWPLLGASSAAAQEVVGAASTLDEVVVTSSRVNRAGFVAPTPMTTLSADEINRQAPSNVGDVLNRIPSFKPSSTPATSGVTSLGGGQIIANLRGLGAQRTLVLVNGKRFVSSNINGTVDLAQIPTLLLDRVEVVTGGASAAWGSDAVAGVVNLTLKDRIDGLAITADWGKAEAGDSETTHISFAFGGAAVGDRLIYMVGADYIDSRGMKSQFSRDWGRRSYGLVTNTAYATNGLPNYIISPNVNAAAMTPGGLINSGPLRGTAFGPGGAPYVFNYGQVYGNSMVGGDAPGTNPALSAWFGKPFDAFSGLAHISYAMSDSVEAYLDISAATSSAGGVSQEPRDAALTIRADNAYLPASVRAQMAAAGLNTIPVGRYSRDTGEVGLHSETDTVRAIAGLKGDVAGWRWEASYQFGRSRYYLEFGPNNRRQQNFLLAADAVRNPANGQIVCRSTLAAPSNGCIPVNIFGDGSLTVNSFVNGSAWYDLTNELQVAAAEIQGEPFALPAGSVSVVFGGEWREVSAHASVDPISQQIQPSGTTGGWAYGNQKPFQGQYSVYEGFAEAVVPLLADIAFAKKVELNGAVRYTDYSTSGGVTTWKIGGTWQVVDGLRFRATRSRDIRAPNISELFIGGSGSFYPIVFDPVRNQNVEVQQVAQPNPNLRPEIANTLTVGVSYEPTWAPRLGLTLDYFDTKVSGVIYTLSGQQIINGCTGGQTASCSSITFNPDRSINFLTSKPMNLNELRTSGLDLEARYSWPLWDDANLALRGFATYVYEFETVLPSGPVDTAGMLSLFGNADSVPRWTGALSATYTQGPILANLQSRLVGSGVYSKTLRTGAGQANTISKNDIPTYAYFDLMLQYGFDRGRQHFEIYGQINNLLDKNPPQIPSGTSGGAAASSTNSTFYDVVGRAYRIGFRAKF